jgi:hypothetical protein
MMGIGSGEMVNRRLAHGTGKLWVLIALCLSYMGLLRALPSLTGSHVFDGSVGVFLGLYTCAQPAGNAIDVLFFRRGGFRELVSGWADVGWVALNMLTMVIGMLVITLGAALFLTKAV